MTVAKSVCGVEWGRGDNSEAPKHRLTNLAQEGESCHQFQLAGHTAVYCQSRSSARALPLPTPLTPTPPHILLSALYLAQAGSGPVTRHAGLAYDGNYPPSSPRLSESADNSLPGDSSAKLATAASQRRLVNHTTLGVSDLAGVVFTCLGAGDKGAQSLAL